MIFMESLTNMVVDWGAVINFLCVLAATGVGAYVGGWLIIKRQESKHQYPRELIAEILSEFSGYKTYQKAENGFNNRSNVEKKAILVALKNLGVPIRIRIVNDQFNIDHVFLDDVDINKNDIKKMINFVKHGFCDDLFFKEIGENFFNSSPKIVYAREIALKVIEAARTLQKSPENNEILIKAANISWYQFEIVFVWWISISPYQDNEIINDEIDTIIKSINDGIFDHLFYWDSRNFFNVHQTRLMASNFNEMVQSQRNQGAVNELPAQSV